ncbi:MAG: fibrobacter succinogenes major paralogous domain-containing protein [Bacteroidales bacterium]
MIKTTYNNININFILVSMIVLMSCKKSDDHEPEIPIELNIEIIRGTVTDIDDNIYETVVIGGKEWMAENLKTTRYNNGTPIEYPGEDTDLWINNNSGAYAWYNNDESNKDKYGAVYNWYAATNTNKLCPAGWRVPNSTDWTQLTDYLISEYTLSNNQSYVGSVGDRLKSCRQVNSPLGAPCATVEHPRWNSHNAHYGFDDFGFSALPISSRNSEGHYDSPGHNTRWWSANSHDAAEAFTRYITYDNGRLFENHRRKNNGYAVRCIK